MRPVSAAFLRTIKGSHKMVARARVCTTFQSGTNPAGTFIKILDGDVHLDGRAQIRSTLDLLTDGNRMWPSRADSLFAPYGNEIYVERGIQYSDDTVEYVGLGYHRIQTPEQEQAAGGPIRISGRDRMAGIVDGRLVKPVQFNSGTTLGAVVDALVKEVYPNATIEWDDSTNTATLTRTMVTEEDRYGFLDSLITARGKVWYWDHRGILVIKTMPNPATPVFEIQSGPGGVLVALRRQLTREGVYNAVVAQGESSDSDQPAWAVALDNNPASPTYYYGRFGPVPRYFTSSFLTSNSQAASAADAILRRELGLPYTVYLRAVANPALEPWDPVSIRAGAGQGQETHLLERITIPLTAKKEMTADTKQQTVVLVGSL